MISKNSVSTATSSQLSLATCFVSDFSNAQNQSQVASNFISADSVLSYDLYPSEYKNALKNYKEKVTGFSKPKQVKASRIASALNSARPVDIVLPIGNQLIKVPKLLHFVWLGKSIGERELYNILLAIHINPNYQTTIWTDRLMSIYSTLDKMIVSNKATYRSLACQYAEKMIVRNTKEVFKELKMAYVDSHKLESLFECEKQIASPYKNHTAASDIVRLAIL